MLIKMPNVTPTKQAVSLAQALEKRGVKVELEHWDGHKHVDLFIPDARLYIEIDGIQHYTDPKQFKADLTRDHYSDDDKFFTKHISNQLIDMFCDEIANTIASIDAQTTK
jgi:very-short-patch-repair endonuclease